MKTDFYTDANGEWRWRVVAENGEIVGASSEGFSDKRGARRNLSALARAISEYAEITEPINVSD